MRVPLSWLSEFTPLGVVASDAAGVAALGAELDSLGLVVEGVERVAGDLPGVVVARVTEIRPIPGADRIRLAVVDSGGPGPVEVVCGAWNYVVGDVVPFATVGARPSGGVEITRRQMRGVTSNGMLCSAAELGLGADSSGLFVLASTGAADAALPAGLELGTPVAEYLGLATDVVFDLEVEPNRPDCLVRDGGRPGPRGASAPALRRPGAGRRGDRAAGRLARRRRHRGARRLPALRRPGGHRDHRRRLATRRPAPSHP